MSTQDPQAQYHDYAAKLEAAKQSVKVDESLRFLVGENSEVVEELKQLEDGKLYKSLVNGYSIGGGIIFISHIIFLGFWVGLIGIILLSAFYFFSKITIDREIKITNNKNWKKKQSDLLTRNDLEEMLASTSSIIDLKIKRFQILLVLTVLFTPLLFMALHELIYGSLNALNIGMSVVIGSFFWMIYFKKDIDELQKMRKRLTQVIT